MRFDSDPVGQKPVRLERARQSVAGAGTGSQQVQESAVEPSRRLQQTVAGAIRTPSKATGKSQESLEQFFNHTDSDRNTGLAPENRLANWRQRTYDVPVNGIYPHVLFLKMHADDPLGASSKYNAAVAYKGSLIYQLNPEGKADGMKVNLKKTNGGGWGDIRRTTREFDISEMVTAAANRWKSLLGDVPLTIDESQEGSEANFIIRTGKLGDGQVAMTRPARLDGIGRDFPVEMIFNDNFTFNENHLETLWDITMPPKKPEEAIKLFFFAVALHEFGHALGLAHPQGDTSVGTDEPITLMVPDTEQIADADVIRFLRIVYKNNGNQPFTIGRINPSEGEVEELRKSMSGSTLPSMILAPFVRGGAGRSAMRHRKVPTGV